MYKVLARLENCKMTEEDINRVFSEATGNPEPLLDDNVTFESMVQAGFIEKDGDDVIVYWD